MVFIGGIAVYAHFVARRGSPKGAKDADDLARILCVPSVADQSAFDRLNPSDVELLDGILAGDAPLRICSGDEREASRVREIAQTNLSAVRRRVPGP